MPIAESISYGNTSLLAKISLDEITWLKRLVDRSSALGPDRLRASDFVAIPNKQLLQAYTQKLEYDLFSGLWQSGRMTLIPKLDDPSDPDNFLLITVTLVLTRGLHKILACHLARVVRIDKMQRGFKPEDGMVANLAIMKDLIWTAKREITPLYITFSDLQKSFDSVYHRAILEVVGTAGLDEVTEGYLRSVYQSLTTEVLAVKTRMTCGMVRGDPLSLTLFKLTLQTTLDILPEAMGVCVAGVLFQYLAFPDDIVLIVQMKACLQMVLKTLLDSANQLGLEPGLLKCAIMIICVSRALDIKATTHSCMQPTHSLL